MRGKILVSNSGLRSVISGESFNPLHQPLFSTDAHFTDLEKMKDKGDIGGI